MQFTGRQIFWLAFASVALQGLTSLAWSAIPVHDNQKWVFTFAASLISYFQGLVLWIIGSQGVKLPEPVKIVFLLIASVFTFLLIGGGTVEAAAVKHKLSPAARSAFAAVAAPAPATDLMSKLQAVKKEIVDGIVTDITAALADASAVDPDTNKPKDAIAAACYPEQIKFLQTLPVAQPFQGKFIAVQLFQRKRDFIIQLQKGLPVALKIGCGALLGDEVNIAIKTLGLVGVAVAAPMLTPLLPAAGALPAFSLGPITGGLLP